MKIVLCPYKNHSEEKTSGKGHKRAKNSNFCGFGDAESDALIEEANTSLDSAKHTEALWKLQAKIYNDQPYVFLYASKNKIAIHKRFDNIQTYFERPGVMIQNLKLNPEFANINLAPNVIED